MTLADRVERLEHSPTLRIAAMAKRMSNEGLDVLDFSVGQPDFPTPSTAKEAGKNAIDANRTGYTANEGILELRAAIAAKLRVENCLEYAPQDVIVSPGAKATLYFLAMALFQAGDEVVIPAPYWVTYPEQVRLADATPVFVEASESNGFRLTASELEAAVTPRTKAVILNYPGNPTGACYDRPELEAIAEVCLAHDLIVIADEIYEKLLYDGRAFTSIASLGPEIKERTVVVNGMSKSYSMTGWRLGYAAGPRDVIDAMGKIQSHSTSNATSIAQWAGLEALRSAAPDVERMVGEFERRRDVMLDRLLAIPGVTCPRPAGAFYAFPNVSAYFGRSHPGGTVDSALDLAAYLLEEALVAVVPGEAFGAPAYVRLSYATSVEKIEEGTGRMKAALERLG
ncbi:MAG: pyridoxal phosphate-dependent aminotransferase [Actinobacteria bacterium]|nr:pyridoxal phosphate-dependent aminotransferase [Actinomycetota bacterium]